MRTLLFSVHDRPRPEVVTPAKGSEGDCTDETQAAMTSVDSIISRYGGNLAEIAGWRGRMGANQFQPPSNLEDALEILKNAESELVASKLPFDSLSSALESMRDGSFAERIKAASKSVEETVSAHDEKPVQSLVKNEGVVENEER